MIRFRFRRGYSIRRGLRPGRRHAPSRPARPTLKRLAASAAALKDASRRASARWPLKNEAILDRGGTRCLGMFRPGRENGTPAEPENVDCGSRPANVVATRNGGNVRIVRSVEFTACGDLAVGGRKGECVVLVSQGWGSVHVFISVLSAVDSLLGSDARNLHEVTFLTRKIEG
jgi:hypothetical protein